MKGCGEGVQHEDENFDSSAFLALVIQTCKSARRRLDTRDSGFHGYRNARHFYEQVGGARVILNRLAMQRSPIIIDKADRQRTT
jgi:hypothetical protein